MITILHAYINVLIYIYIYKDGTFKILSPMVFHNLAPIYFKLFCPPVVLHNLMNRLLLCRVGLLLTTRLKSVNY